MNRGDQPAYPVTSPDGKVVYSGMTIREAFVKAAMQGLLANTEGVNAIVAAVDGNEHEAPKEMARNAITTADAQLAELEATNVKK